MPRVDADIDKELYDRLKMYIARGRGTLYCQQSEVIAEAIKEYLDRHERKIIARG
jgi:metal-responsive CopG/Arc/MetJ family transcriptional regulator